MDIGKSFHVFGPDAANRLKQYMSRISESGNCTNLEDSYIYFRIAKLLLAPSKQQNDHLLIGINLCKSDIYSVSEAVAKSPN